MFVSWGAARKNSGEIEETVTWCSFPRRTSSLHGFSRAILCLHFWQSVFLSTYRWCCEARRYSLKGNVTRYGRENSTIYRSFAFAIANNTLNARQVYPKRKAGPSANSLYFLLRSSLLNAWKRPRLVWLQSKY